MGLQLLTRVSGHEKTNCPTWKFVQANGFIHKFNGFGNILFRKEPLGQLKWSDYRHFGWSIIQPFGAKQKHTLTNHARVPANSALPAPYLPPINCFI